MPDIVNKTKTFPIPHKIAYWLSWNGYLGSHIYWKVALFFSKVEEDVIYKLPNGFILRADSKDWTSRTIYEGTYERALLQFLSSHRFSGLYIDVGANIGSTLFSAMTDNFDATYLAFEPSIQCHTAINSLEKELQQKGRVEIFAVGEAHGNGSLFGSNNPNHSGAASLLNLTNANVTQQDVEIIALDEYIQNEYGTFELDISILKIDTEGFEQEVIKGAKRILATNSIGILILEVSPNFGDTSWIKELPTYIGQNYTWFDLTERHFFHKRPYLKLVSINEAVAATHQFNLVLVRNNELAHLPI